MPKILGIDFGTTNSVMAIIENNEPVVIPNARGDRLTPSIVSFQKNGDLLVGQAAKHQAILHPEETIATVKRFMGRNWSVTVNGKTYSPTDIAAYILQRMKKDAEVYLGESVSQAVITVPAYFNDTQRQAVKDAGKIAGLEVLRIINEPTAAALAYQMHRDVKQNIMVFDLGGGTFDVSVLEVLGEKGKNTIEVLATSGNNYLGGHDFDNRIVDYILKSFKEETGIELSGDKMAMQKLVEEAEKAKIELTERPTLNINIPFITADASGPKHLEMELTRVKFEELVHDLVEQTMGPIQQALDDAGLAPENISRVILVGGSTRVPLVQQTIAALLPGKIYKDINPDECVAVGAAVQTGILTGDVKGIILVDVIPLSLGIKNEPDTFISIIDRNTPIPTSSKKLFTTVCDNQDTVEVEVFQGERVRASENVRIGNFQLSNIPSARKGEPRIEVSFDIDVDGIMHVSAKDLDTGNARTIKLSSKTGMTDEEIGRRIKVAQDQMETDRVYLRRTELRNRAQRVFSLIDKYQSDAERLMEQEFVSELTDCRKNLHAQMEATDLGKLEYSITSAESMVNELVLRLNEG